MFCKSRVLPLITHRFGCIIVYYPECRAIQKPLNKVDHLFIRWAAICQSGRIGFRIYHRGSYKQFISYRYYKLYDLNSYEPQ